MEFHYHRCRFEFDIIIHEHIIIIIEGRCEIKWAVQISLSFIRWLVLHPDILWFVLSLSFVITNICIGWIPFHLCSVKHKHDNDGRAKEEENVHEICLSERAPIEIRVDEREREQRKRAWILSGTNFSINNKLKKNMSLDFWSSCLDGFETDQVLREMIFISHTLCLFTQLCKRFSLMIFFLFLLFEYVSNQYR